jgi:hypothetical protein
MTYYKLLPSPPSPENYDQWVNLGYTGDYELYLLHKKDLSGSVGSICGNFGERCINCGTVSELLCDICDDSICENCSYHTGENEDCCKKHFGGENVVPFEIKLTSGQD